MGKEGITEKEVSARMAGNILMYERSPRVRIGDEIYLLAEKQAEVQEALHKQVNRDRCGVVIAGETADSFDWEKEADFRILTRALRDVVYESPAPEEIIGLLKEQNPNQSHPRLLVSASKTELLRKRVAKEEPYKSWMEQVRKTAEESLAAPELVYYLKDGIRMSAGNDAQVYVGSMAFTYLMTGEEKYAEGVKKILLRVCGEDFPDWHPYHFLDVAQMAAAVAIGYDWCYDYLTAEERSLVKSALVERALKPVLEDYHEVEGRQRTWYWSSKSSAPYPQNWVSVCFGATAMAALAIGDEDLGDFTEAGNVITEGMERLKDYQETFLPDGASVDGTSYWAYAFTYMIYGIASLENALGTAFGLSANPGFDHAFLWLAQMMGPAGAFNLDSNAQLLVTPPEYFWYGAKEGNEAFTNFRMKKHIGEWNANITYKDIIWYEPPGEDDGSELALDYISRNTVSLTIMKAGSRSTDTWLALYGGRMGGFAGTIHSCDGTFVLDMLGKRFALDLGLEWQTYVALKIPRAHFYRCRPEGHNTVVINPGEDVGHDLTAWGSRECFTSDERTAFVSYDLTGELVHKGAKSWKRSAKLDRISQSVTLRDELSAEKPVEYYWFMHTDAQISLREDGRTATLTKEGEQIQAKLTSENTALQFEIMDAAPLPTSPNPPQTVNEGVRKLVVHGVNVEKVVMEIAFMPG